MATRLSWSLSGLGFVRFKLRTLLLFVTIAAFACAAPILWQQYQLYRFKSYADRNLQALSESEHQRFNSIANSVLRRPDDTDTFGWGHTPWFLWRHPAGNLVLLEASHIMSIPGQSSARVTVIDENGKPINQTVFSTGWRIDVVNAERIDPISQSGLFFAINSQNVINGRDVAKQYYAIINDETFLLRIEDSNGNSLTNGTKNHMIGPELPHAYNVEQISNLKSLMDATIDNAR